MMFYIPRVYHDWEAKKITAVQFIQEMNLKRNTFYRRIRECEEINIS